MNLVPRQSLLSNLDSFFDDNFPAFRLLPESKAALSQLAVDIKETDKGYELKADFPGVKKEEIEISVDNNVLTLSAEHKEEKEEKEKGKVIRQERRYGKYSRSFELGTDIDQDKISASFDNGVLTMEIPRASNGKHGRQKISIG